MTIRCRFANNYVCGLCIVIVMVSVVCVCVCVDGWVPQMLDGMSSCITCTASKEEEKKEDREKKKKQCQFVT